MGENTNNTQSIVDYLAQLLKDKKQLAAFPNVFIHVERLLDEEIAKVRTNLFHNGTSKDPLVLPDASGTIIALSEKVYVPVKEHPDFNFVGRILGPRGMTAKQLEQETGCKIMVRGRGSMRDKKKEDQNRGKPNWEHLNDELHVLITVEDTDNRAEMKMNRAIEEIKKLLVPSADGEDELKKRQLMELAIINGTYRDSNMKGFQGYIPTEHLKCGAAVIYPKQFDCDSFTMQAEAARLFPTMAAGLAAATPLRSPNGPLGAPLILSPRMSVPASAALLNGAGPPPLIASTEAGLLYSPYAAAAEYANYAALTSPLLTEYATDHTGVAAKHRRHLSQIREHPYQRAGSLS